MSDLLTVLTGRLALLPALLVSPFLIVRHVVPRADRLRTSAYTGIATIALNVVIPVTLHCFGIPITTSSLSFAHAMTAMILISAACLRRLHRLPGGSSAGRISYSVVILFGLLVLPITYLAGIDTYKWQDLATGMAVEQSIPWLVHPMSLPGFTPRAYPAAQPLLLGTIQIMGSFGVDLGYYVVSLVCGAIGVFSSLLLADRFFGSRSNAYWFAFLYVFSPVFVRYGHWATGRGLFLALLPLFLLFLIELPRFRAIGGFLLTAALLALSHKAGMVAVVLFSCSLLFVPLLPRSPTRMFVLLLPVPFVLLAMLISPPIIISAPVGCVPGALWKAVSRFAWLVPAAAVGIVARREWFSNAAWRRLLPAALLTFPLAFPADMYGALIALPTVVLAATAGFSWLSTRRPERPCRLGSAAVILTLVGALVIVGRRSIAATPPRIKAAADFLETHDPRGPYRLEAPGMARRRIQGYVSGCPRFEIYSQPDSRVAIKSPPGISASPARLCHDWIDYAREMFFLTNTRASWYDDAARAYYVLVDGEGYHPSGSRLVYSKSGVEVFEQNQ